MAQKDITEKALLWYNDVFSDIADNLLFDGKGVIVGSDLKDLAAHQPYRSDSKGIRDQERDNCKLWIKNEDGAEIRLSYLGIENEYDATNLTLRLAACVR